MKNTQDALVIGGGIIGLSIALRLRQAGTTVTLVDRGPCGREASWAGAGIVSPPNPHRKDPLGAIHRAGVECYAPFCDEVRQLSDIDPQYVPCGSIDLLTTDQFVRMARSDVRAASDWKTAGGEPALELLTAEQLRDLEPQVSIDALGYLRNRITAQVRNPRLLQGLRQACERLGVTVRENVTVTELTIEGRRVHGARTTQEECTADCTVLCAGAWSSQWTPPDIARLIPVHPVKGQILLLRTPTPVVSHIINRRHGYLVPRSDGLLLVGATVEPEAGFDQRNSARGISTLIEGALAMVPDLAHAQVEAMWAGLRPGTPDSRPYIGPVPGYEGLIAATGHYRLGLTLAPVTADIVKDLIVNKSTPFDLSYCAPGRGR